MDRLVSVCDLLSVLPGLGRIGNGCGIYVVFLILVVLLLWLGFGLLVHLLRLLLRCSRVPFRVVLFPGVSSDLLVVVFAIDISGLAGFGL